MIAHDVSGFVFAAYAVSGLGLAGLGFALWLDARGLRRALAALEARGVSRRSGARPRS